LFGVRLIERLGPYLEAEAFHLFKDVVVALEHHDVEVVDGVVLLVVHHIEQGSDLRELPGHMSQECLRVVHILVGGYAYLEEHHEFAGARGANHQVAKEAFVIADVVEGQAVLVGIVADGVANLVADVVLQPALLDGQHLVEGSGDVEAHGVHLVVGHFCPHLLFGEPALVREGELELVAIELGLFRAQYRRNLGQLHLTDTGKVVGHLLLLVLDLVFVAEALPFAAAAHAIVLAEGHGTLGRVFVKLHGYGFGILVLLALDLQIDYIAGYYIRNKNDQVVHFGQRFAFGGHIGYRNLLQKGKRFLLS